jgi:hypothetical protein
MKRRKEFLLDESTIALIEKFRDERHLQTLTAALTEIVEEHAHQNDVPATQYFIEELSKQIAKQLNAALTRIRLGVNNADRNSDIIIMLLNTLLSYSPYKTLVTEATHQLVRAQEIEKERIAHFRQKKLDAAQRKANQKKSSSEELITEDDLLEGV